MIEVSSCPVCREVVDPAKTIAVKAYGNIYHKECNVCVQCFQPFQQDSPMFQHENRVYCQHDYWQLFGSRCSYCSENIIGQAVMALGSTWHPHHFNCEICDIPLTGKPYSKEVLRPRCLPCHKEQKKKQIKHQPCSKCKEPLGKNFLFFKGLRYHPYHFKWFSQRNGCYQELNSNSVEKDNKLYCLSCFNKINTLPTCAGCQMVIEKRFQTALGKYWHPEHFVCKICECQLTDSLCYQFKGHAYCKEDFKKVCGDVCIVCQVPVVGLNKIVALGKVYCPLHFKCFGCDKKTEKFISVDSKIYCSDCFEEFSDNIKKKIVKMEEAEKKYQKQKLKKEKEIEKKIQNVS